MDFMPGDTQAIIQNNHGLAFLAAFIGGLISAASPCVLAAIPLIMGYVGGYSEGNKKKAALYSLVFIFTYAVGHCALIFVAGLSIGLTESLVKSWGVQNFSLYAKKLSGTVLAPAGVYIGVVNF